MQILIIDPEGGAFPPSESMTQEYVIMKTVMRYILIAALVAVFIKCGYELWEISGQYAQEAQIKAELAPFRPEIPKPQNIRNESGQQGYLPEHITDLSGAALVEVTVQPAASEKIVNQSIAVLQNEVNNDIIGWLTIPDTHIDYPVVIAKDNDYYLQRNIYKKQAAAGSIFMDCRCMQDFGDFNTVIYGHCMKNKSMFGDLKLFADPDFFDSNVSGMFFLKDNTYTLGIFAYMVISGDDTLIYDPTADKDVFFEYVRKNARQYREPAEAEKVVTLSTCAYEYDGARMVLLATIGYDLHPFIGHP